MPYSYENNDYTTYPVLYLLDGNLFFVPFSGMVSRLSDDLSSHIPELIIVGITSSDRVRDSSPTNSIIDYNGQKNEDLNVSGGADKFLRFITSELIPWTDKNFRTNGHRTLIGYSFTGLTATHAMVTVNEHFSAFLVIDFSAWWDNEVMLDTSINFAKKNSLNKPKDLFMATVERTSNAIYPEEYNATWRFIEQFNKIKPDLIKFSFKKYSEGEENHHTMPVIAFYDGLKYIFRGHYLDYSVLYDQPEQVKNQFKLLSARLKVETKPKESLIRFLGKQFLYTHPDREKALFYFNYNTDLYPESSDVWADLGEGFVRYGDFDKAVIHYQKSVELNPTNQIVLNRLKEAKKSAVR